jgi:hypothetical protein
MAMPASVKSIGLWAFSACASFLELKMSSWRQIEDVADKMDVEPSYGIEFCSDEVMPLMNRVQRLMEQYGKQSLS